MNRRDFLATSAISAAVPAMFSQTAAAAAAPSASDRPKVLLLQEPPEILEEFTAFAPGVELVSCRDVREALERIDGASAASGLITPEIIRAGKSLKWVQQYSAGVEYLMAIPELVDSDIIVTNMQRVHGPQIADQVMCYLLAFTRGLPRFLEFLPKQQWARSQHDQVLDELPGKTMLVIGLGGIGSEVAKRASAFGMRVLATDPKVLERPLSVAELHRPEALHSLLPQADVVVSAVPLTKLSRRMLGVAEFDLMKRGVLFINVSRGGVVDTAALISALNSGHVAAAGLDVTDPEPLPSGHPLWTAKNVIITPHSGGQSVHANDRRRAVIRENLRRFGSGEMLLNIVDKSVGY